MFQVMGFIDGVSYEVTVGGPLKAVGVGIVTGSPAALDLLRVSQGEPVKASHTSGSTPLDVNDETSVLVGLYDLTEVTSVEGDAPALPVDPIDPDVVY